MKNTLIFIRTEVMTTLTFAAITMKIRLISMVMKVTGYCLAVERAATAEQPH